MPCYHPLQAFKKVDSSGACHGVGFSSVRAEHFQNGSDDLIEDGFSLPCGRCIGCRLERSRQWATRILFESQLYDENSFITLTYDDANLPLTSGGLSSLRPDDLSLFMKRLRFKFSSSRIRFFGAGEYGTRQQQKYSCNME